MGTLKTDIIIGQGNNNEVTFLSNKFTGTASGNITLPGEGGTTTTNVQQGLCKAWIRFNGESTIAINDSFNMESITDNDARYYTTTYTNHFNTH